MIIQIIQWVARISALLSCLVLLLFVVNGNQEIPTNPSLTECIGLAFFPVGVIFGLMLGLIRPTYGGCVAIVSLLCFYSWHAVVSASLPHGPFFVIFAAPALLYLLSGWLANHRAATTF